MPSYFRETRNVELSTIYYIENQFTLNWSGVSILKTQPNYDKVALPVISVRLLSDFSVPKEIGSTTLKSVYSFVFDIFAKSDGQRLDLADFLKGILSSSWTYYVHSHASGGDGTLDRTDSGRIHLVSITQNTKIVFTEDVDDADRFRHIIAADVRVAVTG